MGERSDARLWQPLNPSLNPWGLCSPRALLHQLLLLQGLDVASPAVPHHGHRLSPLALVVALCCVVAGPLFAGLLRAGFPVKQRDAEAPAQPLIPLSAALHYFVPKSLFLPGLLISLFTSFPCAGDKEESSLLLLFSAVKGMENASLWPFHSRRGEGGR